MGRNFVDISISPQMIFAERVDQRSQKHRILGRKLPEEGWGGQGKKRKKGAQKKKGGFRAIKGLQL